MPVTVTVLVLVMVVLPVMVMVSMPVMMPALSTRPLNHFQPALESERGRAFFPFQMKTGEFYAQT